MEKNRPHGREQNIGSGSVHAAKGQQVNTHGPVGTGPRGGSRPDSFGVNGGAQRGMSYEVACVCCAAYAIIIPQWNNSLSV